jgi:hypothetical protein
MEGVVKLITTGHTAGNQDVAFIIPRRELRNVERKGATVYWHLYGDHTTYEYTFYVGDDESDDLAESFCAALTEHTTSVVWRSVKDDTRWTVDGQDVDVKPNAPKKGKRS